MEEYRTSPSRHLLAKHKVPSHTVSKSPKKQADSFGDFSPTKDSSKLELVSDRIRIREAEI
jgi:hypothetical protein